LITAPLPPAKGNSIGELVAAKPARLGIKKTGEFSNAITGENYSADLALGHRMIRRAADMLDVLAVEPYGQVRRDVAGADLLNHKRFKRIKMFADRQLHFQVLPESASGGPDPAG
jgi:hypothetical protein